MSYTVVIPTIGRPSLAELLARLGRTAAIIVVDDGREQRLQLPDTDVPVRVLHSGGRGPAAARNVGWRAADTEWVAFLDDDVLPGPDWTAQLVQDLRELGPDVGASQGRIEV